MKKKALITGITGMVGSHLADFIIKETDWDIYGVCRWRSPMDNVSHLLEMANNKDRIFFMYADLNDQISLIKVLEKVKPDYVFHLAAQSYPKTSFDAPIDTLNTNILGTARLLEAIKIEIEKDKNYNPIIHVCSSSEVFGRVTSEKLNDMGGIINEESSFHPASPYAISKVGTDLVGRYYAEAFHMNVITTRMFTHTGPRRGDVFHESTFAKQIAMIEMGLIPPIVKVGNLDSLRTYADVRDAVKAYYLLVTINPTAGEYYNIGGTYTCSVGETLGTLLSFSNMKDKIRIVEDPDRLRPIDADLQIPDCRKFIKHTGWNSEIAFEQTMRDLLNYWRERIKMGEKFLTR
jgi:GDPmannose 4,6-dehydratase